MNIAICGATGFIGTRLFHFLTEKGYNVVPITRGLIRNNSKLYQVLSKCHVVINLAGASINKHWSNEYKEKILSSRVDVTKEIVNTINALSKKPELFICASAVGIYSTDKIYDEKMSISYPDTFLSKVVQKWEEEAFKCNNETRTVVCRFGVVLAENGGALKSILNSYKLKTAVTFSCSNNSFPWISLSDLCKAILFIINNKEIKGIVNMVAPDIISYNKFVQNLNRIYSPIFKIKIPFVIMEMFMGENSQMISAGQMAVPSVLTSAGYTFEYPTIETFVDSLK